jgi:hypothetical protein
MGVGDPMRKGPVIIGIVLLILGLIIAVAAMPPAQNITLGPGSAVQITPNTVGSDKVTVSWSGAATGTTVDIASGTPSCSSTGNVLASGGGTTGSVSATLTSGTAYSVFECGLGGTPASNSLSTTLTQSGISILQVIGVVLAIVGVVLLVVGWRSKTKAAAPREVAEGMTAGVGTGMMGLANPDTETTAYAAPATQSSPVAGSSRANLVCSSCGTVNEPWLTNGRQCTRPLANTGQ